MHVIKMQQLCYPVFYKQGEFVLGVFGISFPWHVVLG